MPSTSAHNIGKVYLAQQLASQSPVPAFQERGIGDLQPSAASDIPIVVVKKETNINIMMVLNFLTSFAWAQLTNTAAIAKITFKNIFRHVAMQYWISTPTALFQFPSVTDEMTAKLKSYGLQIDTGRKNTFSGSPSFDHLKEIHKLGPMEGRYTPGYASIQAYTAWMFLQKAMLVYSMMSHAGNNHGGPVCNVSWGLPIGNVTGGEMDIGYLGSKGSLKLASPSGELKGLYAYGTAPVATPIDKTKRIAFAPLTRESRVETEGVIFPYFKGMSLPDKDVIIHVFSQRFISMLGSSPEDCATLWGIVRPGIRSLSNLESGMALAHAYTGIEQSMQNALPISFIIESGMYHGFILHGDFEVMKYSSKFVSVSGEILTTYLQEIGNQEALVRELINIVQTPTDAEGNQLYHLSAATCRRSRTLYHALQSYDDVAIGDRIARVHEIVDKLLFADSFPGISISSILDFLRFMNTGDETILDKYPANLQSGYYRMRGRVFVGLSIFGTRAPTMNWSDKGRTFTIPGDSSQDANLVVQADGKRLLHYIPFNIVPVRNAAAQWNKLFNSGSFTIEAGRKGKAEFTNTINVKFQIGSEPGFSSAYQTIKDIVNSSRATRAIGKKRRMDDDEETETRSAKKGKKKGISLGELM